MRILLYIMLVVSMIFAPAVASASCASMDSSEMMSADHDDMPSDDCDMNAKDDGNTSDFDCAAACALGCPGFNVGIELHNAEAFTFAVVQYVTPGIDIGLPVPFHLDPPPPRA